MTKNLSHELLTLKAVLLMRLIDKKESKEKMLERYLSCSDKVLKGYIEDFFEDEDEVVMDEDEETYTFASAHDHSLSYRDVPKMAVKTIDISLEDDERSVALDRIKKVTITEGNEEIQLAIQ